MGAQAHESYLPVPPFRYCLDDRSRLSLSRPSSNAGRLFTTTTCTHTRFSVAVPPLPQPSPVPASYSPVNLTTLLVCLILLDLASSPLGLTHLRGSHSLALF